MHFRHTSAKIQPKNLKQHFDRGGEDGVPWLRPCSSPTLVFYLHWYKQRKIDRITV